MKHAEDVDISGWPYQVGYTVMFVQQDANFARRFGVVFPAKPRMGSQ